MIRRQTSAPCEDAVDTGDVAPEPDTDLPAEEDVSATEPAPTADGVEADTAATADADGQPEEPETSSPEPTPDSDTASQRRPNLARRAMRWLCRRWAALIVTIAFTLAAAAAGTTYWSIRRPDVQTDSAVCTQVLEAAIQGMTATLNYAPESFDKDFAAAKTHLTGDFLSYYGQFTEKVVAPAVKLRAVKTTASVIQAAISQLTPDKAVVLLFVNQVTTSKDKAEPSLATSSILVTLVRAPNSWLISEINPV